MGPGVRAYRPGGPPASNLPGDAGTVGDVSADWDGGPAPWGGRPGATGGTAGNLSCGWGTPHLGLPSPGVRLSAICRTLSCASGPSGGRLVVRCDLEGTTERSRQAHKDFRSPPPGGAFEPVAFPSGGRLVVRCDLEGTTERSRRAHKTFRSPPPGGGFEPVIWRFLPKRL
jgi:hypothetical protein